MFLYCDAIKYLFDYIVIKYFYQKMKNKILSHGISEYQVKTNTNSNLVMSTLETTKSQVSMFENYIQQIKLICEEVLSE